MEHADPDFLEGIFKMLDKYVEYLASMGLELDEDGDIRDLNTKEKVLKIDDHYE